MSATTNGRLRLRPSGPTAASARAHGGIGRSSSRYAERVSDDLRRIDTSDLARRRAATGLTLLATAALVLYGAGPADRATTTPWLPLLAAAKSGVDAASALFLFLEQITGHRKVCSWCTLAALANLATVPLVWPEARRAWRALRRR